MKNILSGVVIAIGLILILLSTKSEPEVVQVTTKESTTEITTKYTIENRVTGAQSTSSTK